MPWQGIAPNQTFARTDGTRNGTQVWQQADAASVSIDSPDHDTHDQDIAGGLNLTLLKNGGNQATSNIPMGGFKFTNVGDAAATNQFASINQLITNGSYFAPTVGGTANAITLTTGMSIAAYATGQTFKFVAGSTNSSTVTVAIDGLATKAITGPAGTALVSGQIVSGTTIVMTYDGTQFQINTVAPVAVSVGTVMAWPMTTIPSGWLECDGTSYATATYPALFAVIAYSYGGAGANFNVPNYTDYFLRGFSSSGIDAGGRTDRGDGTTGANIGTKQASAILRHNHTITDPGHAHTASSNQQAFGGTGLGSGATAGPAAQTITVNSNTTGITVNNTSANDSTTETRPRNITVKWIILASAAATLPVVNGVANISSLVVSAGTALIAPINLAAGTNLTTAAAGAMEFDGVSFYATAAASSRQVMDCEQFIIQASNSSTYNNTGLDQTTTPFQVFSTGSGLLTVQGLTTYFFEGLYRLSNTGTTSHTWSTLFTLAASASLTGIHYTVQGDTRTTSAATIAASSLLDVDVATQVPVTAASTSATEFVTLFIKGYMAVNHAGTVVPAMQASARPGATGTPGVIVLAGSYFRMWPVGSNAVASVGNWS